MGKEFPSVYRFWAYLLKQAPWIGWKKAIGVVIITGTMMGGLPGIALAAEPAASQGAYDNTPVTAPQIVQPDLQTASGKYFSTNIDRSRSSGPQPMSQGAMAATATTTRCPAFVTWEDWGGARVHAYVDFRASDLCNGLHVKKAYVRLIRQCGPYYDTGRIYTYTASSIYDTTLYSVSAWIFDSPIWSCNTNTYYGYEYF